MQETICSADMSLSSFQSGLASSFAHRSQTALTMAAVARWIASSVRSGYRRTRTRVSVRT